MSTPIPYWRLLTYWSLQYRTEGFLLTEAISAFVDMSSMAKPSRRIYHTEEVSMKYPSILSQYWQFWKPKAIFVLFGLYGREHFYKKILSLHFIISRVYKIDWRLSVACCLVTPLHQVSSFLMQIFLISFVHIRLLSAVWPCQLNPTSFAACLKEFTFPLTLILASCPKNYIVEYN